MLSVQSNDLFCCLIGKAGGVNVFQILQGTVEVFPTPTGRLTYLQSLPLWLASTHEPESNPPSGILREATLISP